MSDGAQTGGTQTTSSFPTINPLVGGVVGAFPLGQRFMRGYGVAAELQLREYERRRKEQERQQLEKALGMPLGQFEGETKAFERRTSEQDRAEKLRLREAEVRSRDPVGAQSPFTYLSKPPVLPPDVSEPPMLTREVPFSPDRSERAGQPGGYFSDRAIQERAARGTLGPQIPDVPAAGPRMLEGPAAIQSFQDPGAAPTIEPPVPSETQGTGYTERPATPAEIFERQTQSGIIGPGTALDQERKIRNDAAEEKLKIAFAATNPNADEQNAFDASLLRGGAASASTTLRVIMKNREDAAAKTKADEVIDRHPDLEPIEKDVIKDIPPGPKRQAAIAEIAKRKETVRWHGELLGKMQQRLDTYSKSVEDRVEEWRKKREDPVRTLHSFEKERSTALREVSSLTNRLQNPLNGLLLFKKEDDREVLEIKSRIAEYQERADVAQRAINDIRQDMPEGNQPGMGSTPPRPPAAGGGVSNPRASPPPATQRYKPGEDPAGLFSTTP